MSTLDASPAAGPPRRGWFRRNWKWFVPLAAVGLLLGCAGVCVGVFAGIFGAMKSSEPYRVALRTAQQDSRVIERLGQPIEDVWWRPPSGRIEIRNGGGNANLMFRVRGPKGHADVRTQARRRAGEWETTVVEVFYPDGTKVALDAGGSEDEAPLFRPGGGGEAPKFDAGLGTRPGANGEKQKSSGPADAALPKITLPEVSPPDVKLELPGLEDVQ